LRLSNTFTKTRKAYQEGYRFIINSGGSRSSKTSGGSRSSKTYSTLQLLYILAKNSPKKRIVHVISISIPHLRDGAITDFDLILQGEGENLDEVKIKTPYTYTIGNRKNHN
jgi:phage terminase large subunit